MKHMESLNTAGCRFEKDEQRGILYKICRNPSKASAYSAGFLREYASMRRLSGCRFFPSYYGYGGFRNAPRSCPYISMEYIPGATLESILESRGSRTLSCSAGLFPLLSPWEICRLFSQLCEALETLSGSGILYYDLNPSNIIVIDQDFNIRLVDFTFCCHHSDPRVRHWKMIDGTAHREWPRCLALEEAFLLLFSRLFYAGNSAYAAGFSRYSGPADAVSRYFLENYGVLLRLLFYRSGNEDLSLRILRAEELDRSGDYTCLVREWTGSLLDKLSGTP